MNAARVLCLAAALASCASRGEAAAPRAVASSCEAQGEALTAWGGVWIAGRMEANIGGRCSDAATRWKVVDGMMGFDVPWNETGVRRFEDRVLALEAGARMRAHGVSFPAMMGNAPQPFAIVVAPRQTVIVGQYRD